MFPLLTKFFEMPRRQKRLITLIFDLGFIFASLIGALYIRVGVRWYELYASETIVSLIFAVSLCSLTVAVWIRMGLYRAVIRFLDVKVLTTTFWACMASVIILVSLSIIMRIDLPRSVPFIYVTLILILVTGSRLLVRGLVNSQSSSAKIPVAIYGAGYSGRQLNYSLQLGLEYEPVLIVDDDVQIQGSLLSGVRVIGPDKLAEEIHRLEIKKLLLAVPSANKKQKKAIFNKVKDLPVDILTIPGSADLVSGKVSISQLRSVEIKELLGRDPVEPNMDLLKKCVTGRVVLVSGAGGSIGSELCRQIVKLNPKKLILLDINEFNLYSIERELHNKSSEVDIFPLLGSVADQHKLDQIFRQNQVDTIYHAAAYKHVPIVEQNISCGINNNVFGTQVIASLALKNNVKNFVLISTDKAVRPTNIMGSTKRVAELIIQELANRESDTTFSIVRFGNVLGSSGSVIPLFKKQIEDGGPVTVTHPEITRYFMTIPEAASLVIQAGSMSQSGDVFVLDMGKPVKIYDLAQNMIRLMGSMHGSTGEFESDIEIEFTGLRPGEKLYEELLIGENVETTQHPRIMKAQETFLTHEELSSLLKRLQTAMEETDLVSLVSCLTSPEIAYKPQGPSTDPLWSNEKFHRATIKPEKVVNIGVKQT